MQMRLHDCKSVLLSTAHNLSLSTLWLSTTYLREAFFLEKKRLTVFKHPLNHKINQTSPMTFFFFFFLAKFHSASAATKYWCWFTLPRVHVICFLCQSCNFPDTYRYTFPCQKCLFILCDKTVEVCGCNSGKPKVSMSCLCLIICESICC